MKRFLLALILLVAGGFAGICIYFKESPEQAIARIQGYFQSAKPKTTPAPAAPEPTQTPEVVAATPTPTPQRPALEWLAENKAQWPKTVTLKEAIELPSIFNGKVVGSIRVAPGTILPLTALTATEATVTYRGATKVLPVAQTNLPDIAPALMARALAAANATPAASPTVAPSTPAPAAGAIAKEEGDKLIVPLDPEMVKRHKRFGWTEEEFRNMFDHPLVVPLDAQGLDRTMLKPPPAAGIHPRVLFNPEDIPDIRKRLKETNAGKAVMASIRQHLDNQLNVSMRIDYDKLAKGPVDEIGLETIRMLGFIMPYECFRCLIDDDKAGGAKAAAAVANLAEMTSVGIDKNRAEQKNPEDQNDFRVVAQGPSYEGTLGLSYDFAYNFMTPEQRDKTREALVKASAGMSYIGCESVFSPNCNMSNWIPWSSRMLFVTASIEGEKGFDPAAHQRATRAMTAFIGSIYETGEAFEGWGKNFLFIEHQVIMAKRGNLTIANAHMRNAFRRYFISAMNPWGNGFTFCDSLGGTDIPISRTCDVMMYHFFYPNDVAGDFVLRNQLKSDYANLTPGGRVNTSHPFSITDALCSAIFARDYDPKMNWEQSHDATTKDRPLTLFSEDTCNLMTRSSWSPQALYLNYLNRAVPGGHRYSDRSHFSIYADGRVWGFYRWLRQVREQYLPINRSVMMCDDDGPTVAPGKCIYFDDQPQATAITTDLKPTWDYICNYLYPNTKREGIVRLPFSMNDFRLNPSPVKSYNLPMEEMPDWYSAKKPEPLSDSPGPGEGWTKRNPPINYCFRTAILVRGKNPYVLIVDDMQRDKDEHTYTWGMTIPDDISLGDATFTGDAKRASADLVLDDQDPNYTGPKRHMLIRVLEAAQLDKEKPGDIDTVSQPNPPQPNVQIKKVVVRAKGLDPKFKTLLFPFKKGEELPRTTWSENGKTLTISWAGQQDLVTFNKQENGRTLVQIERGGQPILPAPKVALK